MVTLKKWFNHYRGCLKSTLSEARRTKLATNVRKNGTYSIKIEEHAFAENKR